VAPLQFRRSNLSPHKPGRKEISLSKNLWQRAFFFVKLGCQPGKSKIDYPEFENSQLEAAICQIQTILKSQAVLT
jgi:hypothetical protein